MDFTLERQEARPARVSKRTPGAAQIQSTTQQQDELDGCGRSRSLAARTEAKVSATPLRGDRRGTGKSHWGTFVSAQSDPQAIPLESPGGGEFAQGETRLGVLHDADGAKKPSGAPASIDHYLAVFDAAPGVNAIPG